MEVVRVSDTGAIRNPEVYLYTVASNLVKEHAALERRRASSVDIEDVNVQQLLGQIPPLDGSLDTTRRAARLQEVLAQLPPKCRAAVVLHYRDEWSYQQIADQLNVSAHMVKKYLTQALGHCRRRMARLG